MFAIDGRFIGNTEPPYIIAELSANHNGSLEKALETIKAAKDCGANAVKLQTYTAESMTIDCDKKDFQIKGGLWDGYKLFDLYKEASTPYDWHEKLFDYAKSIGISIFSTPFDEKAVDLLDKLNTPAYKIASFELLDLPLIQYIASKKKPILISTGMGNTDEIEEAVKTAQNNGCKEILLFHCISSYPTPTEEANLGNLVLLKEKYNLEVGLSDHTLNNTASIAAVALGASAIEKHFTLSRTDKGPDSDFSIEPNELKELTIVSNQCFKATKNKTFSRPKLEQKNMIFRRSLYFVTNMNENEKITHKNIKRIRPGYGIAPKYIDKIIGKRVSKKVSRGDAVTWDKILE